MNQFDVNKKISINIYGRCVGRDLFELGKDETAESIFSVEKYVGNINWFDCIEPEMNGIVTKNKEPLNFEEFLANPLFGEKLPNFLKKMLYLDFNKSSMQYLFEKKTEWFLFDTSVLALPLYSFDNVLLTKQFRFRQFLKGFEECGMIPSQEKCNTINVCLWDKQLIKEKCKQIVKIFKKYYKETQIIVLEVKYADLFYENGILKAYAIDSTTNSYVMSIYKVSAQ